MYNRFRSIILPIMLVAFGLTLVMFQPDFGSFVVITVITVGLLFLAGLPWKYFFILVGSVLTGMALMIAAAPYRMQRVLTFLDPWQDKQNTGYQLTQSLMAIGRGDWFGMGLGASLSKTRVSAGGAYRFYFRHYCRRIRFLRYVCAGVLLRLAGHTRVFHRQTGA